MTKPEFLHAQAGMQNRTYVGTNICPDEQQMLDIYNSGSADKQTALNHIRTAVQHGADIEVELGSIDLRPTHRHIVRDCLTRIATGNCLAYQLEKGQEI